MMIPLGISGGFQVMVILKKEGNGVMTTVPGTGEREGRTKVNREKSEGRGKEKEQWEEGKGNKIMCLSHT